MTVNLPQAVYELKKMAEEKAEKDTQSLIKIITKISKLTGINAVTVNDAIEAGLGERESGETDSIMQIGIVAGRIYEHAKLTGELWSADDDSD